MSLTDSLFPGPALFSVAQLLPPFTRDSYSKCKKRQISSPPSRWQEGDLAEIQIRSYPDPNEKIFSLRSRSYHIHIPARRSSRWQEADLAEIQIRSYPDPSKKIFLLTRSRSRRDPDQNISRSQQEDLLADKKQISPRSRSNHIQIPARRSSR